MQFALLIYESPDAFASRRDTNEGDAYLGAWRAYHKALLEAGVVIKNGSGLYDANRVTASLLANVLRYAYRDPVIGPEYVAQFDAIYPKLAREFPVIFYPFFLDGVALNPKLNQADGLHPNPAGVKIIVARMLPDVKKLIAKVHS